MVIQGRSAKKTISQEIKSKIINLYKTNYYGTNFEHFQELLKEYKNIDLSYTVLYNIFRKASILSPKVKKYTAKMEMKNSN